MKPDYMKRCEEEECRNCSLTRGSNFCISFNKVKIKPKTKYPKNTIWGYSDRKIKIDDNGHLQYAD